MTLMQKNAEIQAANVMYIRGVPFPCRTRSATDDAAAAKASGDTVKREKERDCPGSLLAHIATADGARPVVARTEMQSQTAFLAGRRNVRVFSDKTVSMRTLRELVGLASGSEDDRRGGLARFIMVEAAPSMDRIAALTADWLREEGHWDGVSNDGDNARRRIFANAPHLAVVYGRTGTAKAVNACALAAARLEWAAMASGLGACFAGDLMRAAAGSSGLLSALSVPAGHAVMAAVLLGYPALPVEAAGTPCHNRIIWL